MMKSGAGRAFVGIGSSYRVGFMTIYTTPSNSTTDPGYLRINDYDITQKTNWFGKLYSQSPGGGTPLKQALVGGGAQHRRQGRPRPAAVFLPAELHHPHHGRLLEQRHAQRREARRHHLRRQPGQQHRDHAAADVRRRPGGLHQHARRRRGVLLQHRPAPRHRTVQHRRGRRGRVPGQRADIGTRQRAVAAHHALHRSGSAPTASSTIRPTTSRAARPTTTPSWAARRTGRPRWATRSPPSTTCGTPRSTATASTSARRTRTCWSPACRPRWPAFPPARRPARRPRPRTSSRSRATTSRSWRTTAPRSGTATSRRAPSTSSPARSRPRRSGPRRALLDAGYPDDHRLAHHLHVPRRQQGPLRAGELQRGAEDRVVHARQRAGPLAVFGMDCGADSRGHPGYHHQLPAGPVRIRGARHQPQREPDLPGARARAGRHHRRQARLREGASLQLHREQLPDVQGVGLRPARRALCTSRRERRHAARLRFRHGHGELGLRPVLRAAQPEGAGRRQLSQRPPVLRGRLADGERRLDGLRVEDDPRRGPQRRRQGLLRARHHRPGPVPRSSGSTPTPTSASPTETRSSAS